MSTLAPARIAWPTQRRALDRGAALPLAAAVLLAAAVATRSPLLIGLALAPAAVVVLTRPERALLVFAFGFYLNLPVVVAHDFHISSGLASAFALLLLSPFLIYVVGEKRPLVVTAALPLMIGYLVVLVLSATLAGGGRASTVAPVMTFLSEGLLLYLLVTNAIRTPKQLRAVIWTVVLVGAFMGVISVWQELTHSYHQTLGGLAQVDSTGFNVGNGLTGKDLRPRLAGPIGEKNRYAQVLLVLLPLAVSRMRAEPNRRLRLLAAACAGLIMCGVVLSFSRGAAVAALILVLVAAALKLISLRQLVATLAVVATLVALVAPDYVTRLQSLGNADAALSQQSSGVDQAIQGRATENIAALGVFRDHPVLGVGPGQFFSRYSAQYGNALDLRFLEQNRRAHNLYLEIAADTGVLGLGAFLAVVLVTLVSLRRVTVRCRARSPGLATLGDSLLLALVAYLASGLFLQLAYQRYFWFLVALANVAIWMLERPQRTPLRAL